MTATAAAARYVLDKGTLDLHGTEPGAVRPHVVNEQIAVDATRIDVDARRPDSEGDRRRQERAAAAPGRTPASRSDVEDARRC